MLSHVKLPLASFVLAHPPLLELVLLSALIVTPPFPTSRLSRSSAKNALIAEPQVWVVNFFPVCTPSSASVLTTSLLLSAVVAQICPLEDGWNHDANQARSSPARIHFAELSRESCTSESPLVFTRSTAPLRMDPDSCTPDSRQDQHRWSSRGFQRPLGEAPAVLSPSPPPPPHPPNRRPTPISPSPHLLFTAHPPLPTLPPPPPSPLPAILAPYCGSGPNVRLRPKSYCSCLQHWYTPNATYQSRVRLSPSASDRLCPPSQV